MHEVIRKVTITAGRQTIARPFPAMIDDRQCHTTAGACGLEVCNLHAFFAHVPK